MAGRTSMFPKASTEVLPWALPSSVNVQLTTDSPPSVVKGLVHRVADLRGGWLFFEDITTCTTDLELFLMTLKEVRAKMKAGHSKRELLFAMKDAAARASVSDMIVWLNLLKDLLKLCEETPSWLLYVYFKVLAFICAVLEVLRASRVPLLWGYSPTVIEILLMISGDVERNPGPVHILNLDDFDDVYEIVSAAKSDWKPLGRRLLQHLRYALDSIESNERDDEERLCKMLKFWLTKTTTLSPSWRSLKEALMGIGREDLAARITDRDTPGVKAQIDGLQRRFNDISHRTFRSLRQQQVDAVDLSSCLMAVSVHLQEIHEDFLDELKKVRASTRLLKLWRQLTKYCDFLNYELLEHVIRTYGPDPLIEDMESYALDLRMFRKKTRLCDFVDNWPKPKTKPPEDKFRKLVAKMGKEWNTCTLEDLELFQEGLTQTFFQRGLSFCSD